MNLNELPVIFKPAVENGYREYTPGTSPFNSFIFPPQFMKRIILFLAMLFSVASVQLMAQDNSVVNNPNNAPYWGIRVSYDYTKPGSIKSEGVGVDLFKGGSGFSAGAIYNLPLVANLYLEPGASLFYDTYRTDDFTTSIGDMMFDNAHIKLSQFGIRIPIMLGYHFDFNERARINVMTGPQFGIGLVGKYKVKGYQIEDFEPLDDDNMYSDEGGFNRLNFQWAVGAGTTIDKFDFSIKYFFGLTNMLKDGGDVKFKENLLQVSVGYNF